MITAIFFLFAAMHPHFYGNILTTGGNCLIPGFEDRLYVIIFQWTSQIEISGQCCFFVSLHERESLKLYQCVFVSLYAPFKVMASYYKNAVVFHISASLSKYCTEIESFVNAG